MDNVAVGEVQSGNAGDLEALTGVGEADCRHPGMRCGNRDTRAGAISLVVEIDPAAGALDGVAAMGTDMDLLVAAAGYEGAAAMSGVAGAAGMARVAAAGAIEILVAAMTSEQHIMRAISQQDVAGSRAAVQRNTGE